MTGDPDQGAPVPALVAQLPRQYVADPALEAGELWWIRRMDWEAIGRAVARCKPGDSFNASWASFMGGLAASAVLGFVSIRWTVATNQKPYSAVQILFGLVAVFSALCGFLIYKIEQRARENRAAFLTALKEELDAAEHYMRKLTEKGGS